MHLSVNSRHSDSVQLANAKAIYDARGLRILRYSVDATNKALNQHRTLSATDLYSLQLKLQALVDGWDTRLDSQKTANRIALDKASVEGMAQTADAVRQSFRGLLKATLRKDDRVVWDALKPRKPYKKKPFDMRYPITPNIENEPTLPVMDRVGLIGSLLGGKKRARRRHEELLTIYKRDMQEHAARAAADKARFERELAVFWAASQAWDAQEDSNRTAHEAEQQAHHVKIDNLREAWRSGDAAAILEHATLVLDASDYGGLFQPDFDLDWLEDARTLVVTYRLPSPEAIPRTKTAHLVVSTGEIKETFISEKLATEIYDDSCYQICLRTIHELYEADEPANLKSVVFNGIVEAVDKATGQMKTVTILSVAAARDSFTQLDLARVDAKACFRALKGVAASSLAGLAAVAPVLQMDKSDRRFIDPKDIVLQSDGGENLAAMPWEDFEHLIRQLFEMVFSKRGGEVKVTQASRDGGVDAVAFDPDPIGGGKIVIQAKRYTRTVGVAAVRDLYGTVMAEGANKGILVTTADYGPDAYQFAAGKPLTLLSGANLLHLLGEHGVRARIDLEEARAQAAAQP